MNVEDNDVQCAAPVRVTLTTDRVTDDAAGPLADALHTAGIAVARHTFLPARDDNAYPWGVLLLAASGLPLPLARLLAPASAPTSVTRALVAALGSGRHATLVTLQLKAEGAWEVLCRRRRARRRAGALFLASAGRGGVGRVAPRPGLYRREAAQLLDAYPNARAQEQLHSIDYIDYMVVIDLAYTHSRFAFDVAV